MATYLINDKKGQKKKVDKEAPKDFKEMIELVKRFPSNATSLGEPKEHVWTVAK